MTNGGTDPPRTTEVRAAADHMLQLLDDVRTAEAAKREIPMGSSEFIELAARIARHARVVSRWADLQLQLAQTVEEQGTTISDVRPRPLERVLALWREAQIRLELAEPGSAAAERAVEDLERYRNEYQAGFAARRDRGQPDGAQPDGAQPDAGLREPWQRASAEREPGREAQRPDR
jgi:hypothetical protein